MTRLDGDLPEGAIALGSDNYYVKVTTKDGTWVGIDEWHHPPDEPDRWCVGWIAFDVPPHNFIPDNRKWTVVSTDPLHIEPSLLCSCGSHGFIREGKWIPA